jgi:hypothetical protein
MHALFDLMQQACDSYIRVFQFAIPCRVDAH